MIDRREFHPIQAEEIATAFRDEKVDYLFIGKSSRQKDKIELPLWESFRGEFKKRGSQPLRSTTEITSKKKSEK
jgi:hypothetical protein